VGIPFVFISLQEPKERFGSKKEKDNKGMKEDNKQQLST